MCDFEKYEIFISKLINDSPEFMVYREELEDYLVFDRFIMGLSDKAMPWLFKVYLDKNYNILRDDEFTQNIKKKYKEYNLKLKNIDGNIFLNKYSMYVILKELNLVKQLLYNDDTLKFNLV